jgi:phospholipid/cholesterol/gamma-HCH transport system permease protein
MASKPGILHTIGKPLLQQLSILSQIGSLFLRTLHCMATSPWRFGEISQSIVQIGIGSLPIIIVSTTFAGLVITNEIAWHMDIALHTITMIPGFTGQFVLREIGIAIPALLLVSKVGASITAEISSMKITEQLDALKLLGIDPVSYLVVPRFIATVISATCLTLIAIAVTLVCAITVALLRYHFSLQEYLNALRHFVTLKDIGLAMVKGTVFGAVIPIVSCSFGFECDGGAEGVGSATTNSVVASTIGVIFLDFLLTYLFTFAF